MFATNGSCSIAIHRTWHTCRSPVPRELHPVALLGCFFCTGRPKSSGVVVFVFVFVFVFVVVVVVAVETSMYVDRQ